MGLANIEAKDGYTLTDELKPRQFSELIDMDYEVVCLLYSAYAADNEDYGRIVGGIEDYAVSLMDMFLFVYDEEQAGYFTLDDDVKQDLEDMHQQLTDAQAQMLGENYSRMVLKLNLPEEGDETFNFLQTVHKITGQYYDSDDFYLVGNSTSDYDLSTSFAHDNVMISVLSVVFVILVLLFTFQSVGLPVLLILVIQGSIFFNFSFPGLTQSPIFFLSYLIVTSIQMGANIDLVPGPENDHGAEEGHCESPPALLPHGADLRLHPGCCRLPDRQNFDGRSHCGHWFLPEPRDPHLHVPGHVRPAADPAAG